jgi:hypothetical protein
MRELDRRRQLGLEENASRWLPYELKGMERGGGRLRKEPVTTRAALSRDARTGTRTVTLDCDSYRRYAGGARRGKVFRDLRSLRRSASRKENTGDPSLGPPRRGRKRCAEVSESTERRGRSDGVLQVDVRKADSQKPPTTCDSARNECFSPSNQMWQPPSVVRLSSPRLTAMGVHNALHRLAMTV